MGNKTKVGKQRKDKFYRLAKESGFRSRAAFKLIQLNRKFEFLEKSRVLVDLCAAPGGWMQVAQQNMPVSSIVVGVDLFPIKPIPGCVSIQGDITDDKCRVELTKALQNWKADVFLNDGAPNVGANWLYDAYQQASLTLSALKLATEFLREGGWFVTKIFRSKDYNSLLWVLKQLFKKVHATKPQASRNESAEIFVVCQHYKAPDKLDPKFLQPTYVFKDFDVDANKKSTLLKPEKKNKKAKAEGYADGDYTLFHSLRAMDFVMSDTPMEALQHASEIVIEDDFIGKHVKTTKELMECCKDIRVLGRKELRVLLSWGKALKEELKPTKTEDEGAEKGGAGETADNDELELNEIDKHVLQVKEEEMKAAKKKKRIADKERRKLQEKMSLKMVLKGDEGPTLQGDDEMFALSRIRSKTELKEVTEQSPEALVESDDESDREFRIKPKTRTFQKDEGELDESGKFYQNDVSDDEDASEISMENSKDGDNISDAESDKSEEDAENPLITDLDHRERKEKRLGKVALWFEKDAFKNVETEADEDFELDQLTDVMKKKGVKIRGEDKENKKEDGYDSDDSGAEEDKEDEEDSSSDESDYNADRILGKKKRKRLENMQEKEGFEVVPQGAGEAKKRKLNEEGLALGTLMVSSKKKKRDLVDDAWNRYTFNDDDLPDWFVNEEKNHMKKNVPVPAELVEEYKNKLREINARPIKKIIEAKARKKRRLMRRMEKAKKKAEGIMESQDVTEREKARQIQKLYKKAQTKRKELTYIVAKRHTAAKRVRRPLGVKGPYKVVDPRMKKDQKQKKRQAKMQSKGKGKAGGKGRRK